MLPPDSNITRQLAHERQTRLKQAWMPADSNAGESGRRRPSLRLAWVLAPERPTRFAT